MRAFSLILGTFCFLLCVPFALAGVVGVLAICGLGETPAAVATAIAFGGFVLLAVFGWFGTTLYRLSRGASDLEYQLCAGLPTVIAGFAISIYAGRLYDTVFSMMVFVIGMATVIVGFIQCFGRIDTLPHSLTPLAK